ncbi:MAG: hypothetical protein ABIH26_09675 [Candidatus Eisenbacteria bacterium]
MKEKRLAPRPPGGRSPALARWAAALAVVLLVRLIPVLAFAPDRVPPSGDIRVYVSVSKELARSAGAWAEQGGEFGYRAPLFFAYLAAIWKLVPSATYKIFPIAVLFFGVLDCLLIYRIGLLVAGRRAAWAAFWIRGLLPAFVIHDTFPVSETLFTPLLLGAVLILLSHGSSPSLGKSALLGLLIGAAVLTRESAVGFPVVFGIALVLLARGQARALPHVFAFALLILVVLTPWLWRNQAVWGSPLPLANTSGVNLHIGNNPEATGKHVELDAVTPEGMIWGSPAFGRWHRDQAIAYMRENPGRFLANGFRKISWLLFPSFHRDDIRVAYGPPERALLALVLASGAGSVLLLLGGLSGLLLNRAGPYTWLTAALALYFLGGTFLAHGHPRYRDPIDQMLVLHAATLFFARRDLPGLLRSSSRGSRARLAILAALVASLLVSWAWVALGKADL